MLLSKLLLCQTKPLISSLKVSQELNQILDKIEEAVVAQNEAILLLEAEI